MAGSYKKGEPFSSIDDPGFEKVFKLAEECKLWMFWKALTVTMVMCLTSNTKNELNVILTGLLNSDFKFTNFSNIWVYSADLF